MTDESYIIVKKSMKHRGFSFHSHPYSLGRVSVNIIFKVRVYSIRVMVQGFTVRFSLVKSLGCGLDLKFTMFSVHGSLTR